MSILIIHNSRANVTNFFSAVIYECWFVPGRLFQPWLMLVGKAWGLSKSGAPERGFTRVGSLALPQTLDLAGKACHGLVYYKHSNITEVKSLKHCPPGPRGKYKLWLIQKLERK